MMPHKKSTISKLVQLGLVTMLSACSIWPDYTRPTVVVPEKYSQPQVTGAATNSQVISNWWTLYQDPALNDLVEKSLQNNTDLQLAAARIEEADAVMREAGAYLFPQVNLDADATRTRVTEA